MACLSMRGLLISFSVLNNGLSLFVYMRKPVDVNVRLLFSKPSLISCALLFDFKSGPKDLQNSINLNRRLLMSRLQPKC